MVTLYYPIEQLSSAYDIKSHLLMKYPELKHSITKAHDHLRSLFPLLKGSTEMRNITIVFVTQ